MQYLMNTLIHILQYTFCLWLNVDSLIRAFV